MAIAGAIFAYYVNRNMDVTHARARSLRFASAAAVAVVASCCIGLGVAGTPRYQRHVTADQARVEALRTIAFSLHAWAHNNPALPPNLNALQATGLQGSQLLDPESKRPYVYRIIGGTRYQLCATFFQPNEDQASTSSWRHGQGQTCFNLDAGVQPSW
jgi:hypothetical protein